MPTDDKPADGPSLEIRTFDPSRHVREGFDCGVERLNNFLTLNAKKQQKDDMTRVYVAVAQGDTRILGYHAINAGIMDVSAMKEPPKGTPAHNEIPILFLGQVAVDRTAQGQGIGSILMNHVFEKAISIGDQVGCYAIVLDVMSDGGEKDFARRKAWYEEFGFQAFVSNPARMFMSLKAVRARAAALAKEAAKAAADVNS